MAPPLDLLPTAGRLELPPVHLLGPICVAVAVAALFNHNLTVMSAALSLGACWPALMFALLRDRMVTLSHPVVFVSLIFFASYSAQAFLAAAGRLPYSLGMRAGDELFVEAALIMAAIGFTAFLTGFVLAHNAHCRSGRMSQNPSYGSPGFVCRITKALLVVFIGANAAHILIVGSIPGYYQSFEVAYAVGDSVLVLVACLVDVGFAGFCCAVLFWQEGRVDPWFKRLLWLAVAIELIVCAGAGAKAVIVKGGLAFVIGYDRRADLNSGRSLSRLFVYVFLALALVGSFRLVSPYRVVVALDGGFQSSGSLRDNVRRQLGYFKRAIAEGPELLAQSESYTDQVGSRVSNLSLLMRVLACINNEPSYENLDKVPLVPLYAVLPRSLLPDKAVFMNSGAFAAMNGWRFGGINITLAGSLYWIAGYWGIVLGFLLIGAVTGAAWARSYSSGARGIVWFCFSALFTLLMWYPEWDTYIINGFRYVIVLSLIAWISGAMETSPRMAGPRPAISC